MGFNTRDAKRQTMSAAVQRWCQVGPPDELRTLLISVLAGADILALQTRLVELDVTVLSSGADVIVATVRCDTVTTVSLIDGIGRVEMPGSYQTKPGQNDDNSMDSGRPDEAMHPQNTDSTATDDPCPDDS